MLLLYNIYRLLLRGIFYVRLDNPGIFYFSKCSPLCKVKWISYAKFINISCGLQIHTALCLQYKSYIRAMHILHMQYFENYDFDRCKDTLSSWYNYNYVVVYDFSQRTMATNAPFMCSQQIATRLRQTAEKHRFNRGPCLFRPSTFSCQCRLVNNYANFFSA